MIKHSIALPVWLMIVSLIIFVPATLAWYAGINIIRRALEAPLRQIAENAGVDGAVVAGKIRESKEDTHGFNAQTEEYGDMFKFGVIDPAKVVRTALEDAASIAGLLVTTEAMVGDKAFIKF